MNNDKKELLPACQIIVQPVENGFVIQAVNVSGAQSERRLIAADVEDVRKHVHEIADGIYAGDELALETTVRSRTTYSGKE